MIQWGNSRIVQRCKWKSGGIKMSAAIEFRVYKRVSLVLLECILCNDVVWICQMVWFWSHYVCVCRRTMLLPLRRQRRATMWQERSRSVNKPEFLTHTLRSNLPVVVYMLVFHLDLASVVGLMGTLLSPVLFLKFPKPLILLLSLIVSLLYSCS